MLPFLPEWDAPAAQCALFERLMTVFEDDLTAGTQRVF
jgi:hypothetical protein